MGDPHLDFQSVEPGVTTKSAILEKLSEALDNQFAFRKKTFTGENTDWGKIDLETFKLDLNYVDRLYYLYVNQQHFRIICRMVYNTKPVFVELSAKCCISHRFKCRSRGYIFVTRNPNTFFRVFLADLYCKRNALNSLRSDGYVINTEDTLLLKHLSRVENYGVLPKELKDGMDELMRIQKCKDFYEKEKREYTNYSIHHNVLFSRNLLIPKLPLIYNRQISIDEFQDLAEAIQDLSQDL